MINPNELRIGSILHPTIEKTGLKLPTTVYPVKVVSIGLFEAECMGVNENPANVVRFIKYKYSDLSPIPLTEELLLKCGFSEDQGLFDVDEYPVFIKENVLLSCVSWDKDVFFYDVDLEVKSLHRLQNLYLALTGKELDVCL